MIIEALKAFLIGVVEGITEWLPISSTGHMILVDEFIKLDVGSGFLEMFLVVIQLGAILAVIILFFHKLNPFSPKKTPVEKKGTWRLWGMVLIGCIPAAVVGLTLDDWFHENFYNAVTVSIALIVYGVAFIAIEIYHKKKHGASTGAEAEETEKVRGKHARANVEHAQAGSAVFADKGMRGRGAAGFGGAGVGPLAFSNRDAAAEGNGTYRINTVDEIDPVTALKIGAFQMLAILPGTSRSGSTIIGGLLCGCSRVAASEFSFFLAIPVMFGWGLLKTVRYLMSIGPTMTSTEIMVLVIGIATAFVVSVASIKFLLGFVKKHSFIAFGIYRIAVGVIVLAFFAITGSLFITQ